MSLTGDFLEPPTTSFSEAFSGDFSHRRGMSPEEYPHKQETTFDKAGLYEQFRGFGDSRQYEFPRRKAIPEVSTQAQTDVYWLLSIIGIITKESVAGIAQAAREHGGQRSALEAARKRLCAMEAGADKEMEVIAAMQETLDHNYIAGVWLLILEHIRDAALIGAETGVDVLLVDSWNEDENIGYGAKIGEISAEEREDIIALCNEAIAELTAGAS